jgi:hypothetical protein
VMTTVVFRRLLGMGEASCGFKGFSQDQQRCGESVT